MDQFANWAIKNQDLVNKVGSMAYRAYKNYGSSRQNLKRKFQSASNRPAKRARGNRKAVRGQGGVTAQHDIATIYRKKSMPKYKRRKWKSFIRKVQAVHERELGVGRLLFNEGTEVTANAEINPTFGTLGNQSIWTGHLYGGQLGNASKTGLNIGNDDIQRIWRKQWWSQQTTTGVNVLSVNEDTTKLKFISAIFDFTFTADGQNTVPLEVDLYHIVYTKNWNNDLSAGAIGNSTYDEQMDQYVAQGEQFYENGIYEPRLRLRYRGTTPFEMSEALSAMGIKILKKVKHFVPPGANFTYQIRDPKTHIMDKYKFNSGAGGTYLRNLTQTCLIVAKPTYYTSPLDTFTYHVGATRTYKVQKDDITDDFSCVMDYATS